MDFPTMVGTDDLRELASRLFRSGDDLPSHLRDEVLAAGDAMVSHLVEVIRTGPVPPPNVPPTKLECGTLHAVELLGQIGSPVAVGPLLALLRRGGGNVRARNEIWLALLAIGPAALEPALDFHDLVDEPAVRDALARMVAELGVRNRRTVAVMLEALRRSPEDNGRIVAQYGDHALLPEARRLLELADPLAASLKVLALAEIIEDLGSRLSSDERSKQTTAHEVYERAYRREIGVDLRGQHP